MEQTLEKANKELSKLEVADIRDRDYRKQIIKALSDATVRAVR